MWDHTRPKESKCKDPEVDRKAPTWQNREGGADGQPHSTAGERQSSCPPSTQTLRLLLQEALGGKDTSVTWAWRTVF